ncbi:MAG TPA: YHS domain-containing protein [Firmicutes bacterium]|jgi:YHS domain-containing protein|nr:YHS domain-containing protein [Bacillota bacterium]
MPKDPVCGMDVRDDKTGIRSDFRGQTYHFCSDRCKSTFDQDPQHYANLRYDNRTDRQSRNRNKGQDDRPLR